MVNHEKITSLMKEKGIKAKELAGMVGVSEAMMSYIANGFREPNVATLVRIAKVFGVTVDELVVA